MKNETVIPSKVHSLFMKVHFAPEPYVNLALSS